MGRPDRQELKRLAIEGHFEHHPKFGRGPMFGGGRGRRRRGDVRAALLLLIAEEPLNGYQLMQEIEGRSGGRWRPSPGSIYPTLSQLEDEKLIRATDFEGNKLYELTDAGREHLEAHHGHTPPWDDHDEPEAFSALRSQVSQLQIAALQVAHAGREDQVARAAAAVSDARRAVYRILAEDDDE